MMLASAMTQGGGGVNCKPLVGESSHHVLRVFWQQGHGILVLQVGRQLALGQLHDGRLGGCFASDRGGGLVARGMFGRLGLRLQGGGAWDAGESWVGLHDTIIQAEIHLCHFTATSSHYNRGHAGFVRRTFLVTPLSGHSSD
jgi:hypothetical protein